MAGIFSHLNLANSDRVFNATVGQQVIYEAAMDYINRANAEIDRVISAFVSMDTENFKERYRLPGGGYLQRRREGGRYGAVSAYGSWDVAYPLEDFGAQIAGDDVSRAYMTVAELENHVNTIVAQNVNTVRFELLKALLNNTNDTFVDPIHGSLTIVPLANADAVTYPPVLGSAAEATDSHYLESGYAATAISDTNNPYVTIVEELVEHFGESVGGDEVAVFINPAEAPETEDLTDFTSVPDQFVRVGQNTDVPIGLPSVPGRIIGRMSGASGAWVVQWRWIPASYMVAIHLGVPAPLKRRVDPADTGLGRGLQLVATDTEFPFESSFWRHRFGFGVSNRLNGVVMELGTGGSYSIPSGYS